MTKKRPPKAAAPAAPTKPTKPTTPTTPAAAATAPPRRRGRWIAAALLLAFAAALGLWSARNPTPATAPAAPAAAAAPPASWVANASCLGCHPAQAAGWAGSHHARAMAPATAESVSGDFGDTQFRHQGVTTRFFKRGDRFFVHTDGPDGKLADFEIKYSFGVEPLQQYLIDIGGGRLQPLQIAWNTRERKWFHLLPHEKAPPGDVLHWSGRYQTANTMCIACHTTGFDKRYDAAADRFDSHWLEVNVSCQSCHGPGSRHVEAPQRGPLSGLADLKTPRSQVEVCAACHSRRSEFSAKPVPGQPHLDHYLPALLREGLYHADGQQLDEVFVVGSYRQSRMYRMGVACSDCHDPHTAKPRAQGNALCLQCHQTPANPAFPSAAGDYDTPRHHHHANGSAGAQCTACHMPAKNYMIVQPRPDHSIRIPRPDLSVALGTPNACNQCHDDQPAQWAADALVKWLGTPKPPPHYGEVFAAARRGAAQAPPALAALAALVADAAQPGIVRATALDALRGSAAGVNERIAATRDADAEVRAAAAASLEDVEASLRVPTLAPLLRDPVRAVRIAAARSLAPLPHEQFDAATRQAFDAALAEYVAAQQAALDMPGPNLNLAVLYARTGRDAEAEAAYRAALKIDPDFTPARANLAQFHAERGRLSDAEQVLREGLQRQPGIGELQYSLGLLLAEQQRLPEAADALERAAKLLPQHARAHYNLGLARQQLGQAKPAEAALRRARELAPGDPAIAYALAVFYAQQGRRADALREAEALQQLQPGNAQAAQLLQRLRAGS
ncbi:MAG TPA: tetratricopeptide repeat protein [Rubrivivax sp.]|nr:tetratricopeptide repeat protein [Rubrivivax sp.]